METSQTARGHYYQRYYCCASRYASKFIFWVLVGRVSGETATTCKAKGHVIDRGSATACEFASMDHSGCVFWSFLVLRCIGFRRNFYLKMKLFAFLLQQHRAVSSLSPTFPARRSKQSIESLLLDDRHPLKYSGKHLWWESLKIWLYGGREAWLATSLFLSFGQSRFLHLNIFVLTTSISQYDTPFLIPNRGETIKKCRCTVLITSFS